MCVFTKNGINDDKIPVSMLIVFKFDETCYASF